jgi:hypothetical protein
MRRSNPETRTASSYLVEACQNRIGLALSVPSPVLQYDEGEKEKMEMKEQLPVRSAAAASFLLPDPKR